MYGDGYDADDKIFLLAFTNFAHSILSFNLVKRRELAE